ncbi:uncharacterized protein EDB93DRAFT_1165704 [Suillus bovinus]|uniref:uncharacterized protein n=1 Tax=Suillus bovinus TaxID=48563 RepID=UPI001B86C539|nr:uncharacterized protein EDB93DRAFT_1165704 [Suillus bovinus]KAG2138448.1 hypothetical protein EDB93DRAFT_1165704 [Suillus bovinus]
MLWLTATSSMMFTSCFTILALLAFLSGANAQCATCQEALYVDGVATYELLSNYVKSENGFTECSYEDKKGNKVTCEYRNDGLLEDGDSKYPKWSRKDEYGC